MKRTKKVVKDTTKRDQEITRWVKNGGGTFRLRSGKIVKPNEIFSAPEYEIPVAFRDNIVPVNQKDVEKRKRKTAPNKTKPNEPKPIPVEPIAYQVQENDNGFSIIDETGKQVTEDFGTREEAEEVLAVLGS